MEYGEIALNYNAAHPFLSFKDSDGDIMPLNDYSQDIAYLYSHKLDAGVLDAINENTDAIKKKLNISDFNAFKADNTNTINVLDRNVSQNSSEIQEVNGIVQNHTDAIATLNTSIAQKADKTDIDTINAKVDKKVSKTDITQSTGTSETVVMSQKAVSDKLSEVDGKVDELEEEINGNDIKYVFTSAEIGTGTCNISLNSIDANEDDVVYFYSKNKRSFGLASDTEYLNNLELVDDGDGVYHTRLTVLNSTKKGLATNLRIYSVNSDDYFVFYGKHIDGIRQKIASIQEDTESLKNEIKESAKKVLAKHKNLWTNKNVVVGWFAQDGSVSENISSNAMVIEEPIKVSPNTQYYLTAEFTPTGGREYDSNMHLLRNLSYSGKLLSVGENTEYIRFAFTKIEKSKIDDAYLQEGATTQPIDSDYLEDGLRVKYIDNFIKEIYGDKVSFVGGNNTFKEGNKVDVTEGRTYVLTVNSLDIPMDGVTVTDKSNIFVIGLFKPSGEKLNYLYVYAENGIIDKNYYVTIPEGYTKLNIGGRCSLGYKFECILREVDKDTSEISINSLNPFQEFADKFANAKIDKSFIFAHFSDIHGVKENLVRFNDFCNVYKKYITERINTGDTVVGYYTDISDWYTYSNILTLIGNHDTASYDTTLNWQTHVGSDAYNMFIAPHINKWGVIHDGNTAHCYYYKDYEQKLRLICIDAMGYDAEQDQWLANTLLSAKNSGLSVVVASHMLCNQIDGFHCNYSSRTNGIIAPNIGYNIGNYLEHATSTVQSFIDDGGVFVCWLLGHTHRDVIGKVHDTNQLVILVDTAQYGNGTSNEDTVHVKNTRSQDSFQVVSVNTIHKTITVYKVGCNRDKWGRKKDSICLDYGNGSIICES